MRIIRENNVISWNDNNNKISIELKDVYYARYFPNKDVIIAKTRTKIKDISYYYYTIDGVLILEYHLETGDIKWQTNNQLYNIKVNNLVSVELDKNNNLLCVISGKNSRKITILTSDGNKLFDKSSPLGYKLVYISEVEINKVSVVCDATIEENVDPYGRDRFNFSLDLTTGNWQKLGFAY